RLEAHAVATPWVAGAALKFGVERDLAGRAFDGEVADQLELAVDIPVEPLALEGHRRESLDVEEIGGAEVCVALLGAGVDAAGADVDLDFRRGRIGFVVLNGALHVGEAALHRGNHEMLDRELDVGVRGIDRPGGDAGAGNGSGGHESPLKQCGSLCLPTVRDYTLVSNSCQVRFTS